MFLGRDRESSIIAPRNRVVALSGSLDRVAWQIALGKWGLSGIAGSTRGAKAVDVHPMRGALADFTPIVVGAHGVDEYKVVVLDLKTHRIGWQSAPHKSLLHYYVVRGSQGQHFVLSSTHVVAIDGSTGAVTGAIGGGYYNVRGFYAVDGRLWMHSEGWARMNALPWAVLDGRTLAVVGRGTDRLSPQSVFQETVKSWAVPPSFLAR